MDESARQTGTWIDLFCKTANKRATIILSVLMAIQQFSGVNVVLFYRYFGLARSGFGARVQICVLFQREYISKSG